MSVFDTFMKIPDCAFNEDESDCQALQFWAVILITLGIVLVGVGIFFVLRYFHIIDLHSTDIIVEDRTHRGEKEELIEQIITQGKLSSNFLELSFENTIMK